MMRKYAISIFVLFLPLYVLAQRTTVYTEANVSFKKGLEFFDLGVYGMAQAEFKKVLDQVRPINEPEYRIIKTKAELYFARSAVRLGQSDGEKLMMEFVRKNRPDPTANQALLELADYYFRSKDYDQAIEFFAMMDQRGFSAEEKDEISFKHGYCLFMSKRYDEAKSKFAKVMDQPGEYYFSSHYYHGMSSFHGQDYEDAIASWNVASEKAIYKNVIPYYITQIHFVQKNYSAVIEYAAPLASDSRVKRRAEINLLVGQSYFEQGDYEKALPYLEYYESKSRKLRKEDFYQLAFVQYKNEKYKESIQNFKQLDKSKTELGQSAMFYLADAYLKEGDKGSAKNAFLKVSKLPFNPHMQEEALFNFAKLSIELHFDRDAVKALQRFEPTSKYYTESQELLSATLVNTKDYKSAIRIIEGLKAQTPQIKEAYQRVCYYQG